MRLSKRADDAVVTLVIVRSNQIDDGRRTSTKKVKVRTRPLCKTSRASSPNTAGALNDAATPSGVTIGVTRIAPDEAAGPAATRLQRTAVAASRRPISRAS